MKPPKPKPREITTVAVTEMVGRTKTGPETARALDRVREQMRADGIEAKILQSRPSR